MFHGGRGGLRSYGARSHRDVRILVVNDVHPGGVFGSIGLYGCDELQLHGIRRRGDIRADGLALGRQSIDHRNRHHGGGLQQPNGGVQVRWNLG